MNGIVVGEHMSRFLYLREEILKAVKKAIGEPLCNSASTFFEKFDDLLAAFDFVCQLISICDRLSDDELEMFTDINNEFCTLWRQFPFPDNNPHLTPKFHLLESHVGAYLKKFRRLGIFSEEAVESWHRQKRELLR